MDSEKLGRSILFQLKNIAYLRFSQTSKYDNVISPFTRMYLITEGRGHLFIESNRVELEPGYLFLIPGFKPCTYIFNEHLAHIYIHFSMEMSSGLSLYNFYKTTHKTKISMLERSLVYRCLKLNPGHQLPHHDPKVYQKKPWINKEFKYHSLDHFLETNGILQQLFSRFLIHEVSERIDKLSGYPMHQTLSYIHENLNDDLAVKKLAGIACISKDHFTRVFKSVMGMPPVEYIIRKRLEKAKYLLLTTDYRLNEIVDRTGFKSSAYFCRIFKKYNDIPPNKFRTQQG